MRALVVALAPFDERLSYNSFTNCIAPPAVVKKVSNSRMVVLVVECDCGIAICMVAERWFFGLWTLSYGSCRSSRVDSR